MSSTFQVTVRTLDRIWPHPGADRLELGSVAGLAYQFCLQKGLYTVGQKVIYFPVDSQLPQWIIDTLDLWGKDESGQVIRDAAGRVTRTMLVGEGQNRVHTVALRGEISQGMVCPLEELRYAAKVRDVDPKGLPSEDGADVTAVLGVTKYDAPESLYPGAVLHPMIDAVGVYDIEGADNYLDIVNLLMDIPVCVTEKLEGTNMAVVRTEDYRLAVLTRSCEIEEIPGEPCTYWDVARESGFTDYVKVIPAPSFPASAVAMRAELIGPGVQKNIYALKKATLRCFDIKVGDRYLDVEEWLHWVPKQYQVPVLAKGITLREWLAGRTLQEASNGKSVLADRLREGIVIKPMVEQKVLWSTGSIRRLILKQRSPQYLSKEKG